MAITIKGKTYRNLQEQVEKNKDDIAEIIKGGGQPIQPGAIDTEKLADSSVTTDKIVNGAVTTEKLANGSVNLDKLASGILNGFLQTRHEFNNYYIAQIEYTGTAEDDDACIKLSMVNGMALYIYKDEIEFVNQTNYQKVTYTDLKDIIAYLDDIKDHFYYDDEEGALVLNNLFNLISENITVDDLSVETTATIKGDLEVRGTTTLRDRTEVYELAKVDDEDYISLADTVEYYSFQRNKATQFAVMAGEANNDYYPFAGLFTTPDNRNVDNDIIAFADLDFDLDITVPEHLEQLKNQCKLLFDYLGPQESYGYNGANPESGGQIHSNEKGKLFCIWTKNQVDYSFDVYISRPNPTTQPNHYKMGIDIYDRTNSVYKYNCDYDVSANTIDSTTYIHDLYPAFTLFPIYGIKNTK